MYKLFSFYFGIRLIQTENNYVICIGLSRMCFYTNLIPVIFSMILFVGNAAGKQYEDAKELSRLSRCAQFWHVCSCLLIYWFWIFWLFAVRRRCWRQRYSQSTRARHVSILIYFTIIIVRCGIIIIDLTDKHLRLINLIVDFSIKCSILIRKTVVSSLKKVLLPW